MWECWQSLRLDDKPTLLMASVGAGKSLMLADILLKIQKVEKRGLCIVNNAELVRNNCETFIRQGGHSSIYCAALKCKDASAPIIFGTPQSILNAINKGEDIASIRFNLIVVDEAHAINYLNDRSGFMRILRHYKQEYPDMRLLGATGTNFRFKGTSIVGDDCLFKRQVGNITTERLIAENYLIKPVFEVDEDLVIDFSKVKVKQNGKFSEKDLEFVVSQNARLTELICKQLIYIMKSQARFGVFIFATTKKHAYEILSHLPPEESAIILGETPQDERTKILNAARKGDIKYLVNIAIISVGVDVPAFDTIAYLRPTESLVLLVQTLGRGLRLSPQTEKTNALVLDFAGNIERHRDWDNPILLDALKQTVDKDKPLVIQCPSCQTMNTEHARRCVGIHNDKRCEYYFEFKTCPNSNCEAVNDIASRHCRICHTEIIDPNDKLKMSLDSPYSKKVEVLSAKYAISDTKTNNFRINCAYTCVEGINKHGTRDTKIYYESFTPCSEKAQRVLYGQFVKQHCENGSEWFPHLGIRSKMEQMIESAKVPKEITIDFQGDHYRIKKKVFEDMAVLGL